MFSVESSIFIHIKNVLWYTVVVINRVIRHTSFKIRIMIKKRHPLMVTRHWKTVLFWIYTLLIHNINNIYSKYESKIKQTQLYLGNVLLRSSFINTWLPFWTGLTSPLCPVSCLFQFFFFFTAKKNARGREIWFSQGPWFTQIPGLAWKGPAVVHLLHSLTHRIYN